MGLTLLRRQVKHPDRDRLLTALGAGSLGPAELGSEVVSLSPCALLSLDSPLTVLLSTDLSGILLRV
jgi:hypothetical protein